MSSDFEEAMIAYAQSLKASWGDAKAREKCKRDLLRIIDAEYGEDNSYSIALKGIIAFAESCAGGTGRRTTEGKR